jgi:hypothetical protein
MACGGADYSAALVKKHGPRARGLSPVPVFSLSGFHRLLLFGTGDFDFRRYRRKP